MVPVPVGKNTYFSVEMTGKSVVMTPEGKFTYFPEGRTGKSPAVIILEGKETYFSVESTGKSPVVGLWYLSICLLTRP